MNEKNNNEKQSFWPSCLWFQGDIDPTADFAEAVGELRETASTLTD